MQFKCRYESQRVTDVERTGEVSDSSGLAVNLRLMVFMNVRARAYYQIRVFRGVHESSFAVVEVRQKLELSKKSLKAAFPGNGIVSRHFLSVNVICTKKSKED